MRIKAIDDFELEVLGIPWGSPDDLDSDKQYFSPDTKLHEDKFGLPPIVHYHGFDPNTHQPTDPEYIGKAISFEDRPDGRWYRVVLDKAKDTARRVWEAARQGIAVASSGSNHLARVTADGFIAEWPVLELSLWPNTGSNPQAHPRAIAIPAKYKLASIPDKTAGHIETNEETDMSEQQEDKVPAVDLGPVLDAVKGISDQVKAFGARVEALETKPTNDPGIAGKAVNVVADTEHWRYDNVASTDLAFTIGVLETAKMRGQSRGGASLGAIKALARRMDSAETLASESGRKAAHAYKSAGYGNIKANEIAQSTLASYGDEWVGVYHSGGMWESIRHETAIVSRIPSMEVPQGAESVIIPLESTDPTWYKVAQAASLSANPGGIPTNTVTASTLGTANTTLTLGKMGARVLWTGEMEEDAVLPYVAQLRMQLAVSAAEYLESAVIDGDTETGAATNINDIADTPGGTEYWLLTNGFRKLALITNSANARDGGALTSSDFLETVKLMGVGGSNADVARTAFIIPHAVHWKALELADVKTRDVFSGATIEAGRLSGIYGYPIYVSHHMHKPQVSRLANTAGKIDLNTAGNNTTSAILAVRFDQWMLGWRRRMTLETTRVPAADSTEIVALMRWGMIYRDTEASAISYNITI